MKKLILSASLLCPVLSFAEIIPDYLRGAFDADPQVQSALRQERAAMNQYEGRCDAVTIHPENQYSYMQVPFADSRIVTPVERRTWKRFYLVSRFLRCNTPGGNTYKRAVTAKVIVRVNFNTQAEVVERTVLVNIANDE